MLCLYYDVDQAFFALPIPPLVPIERTRKHIDSCGPRNSELFACTGQCGLRAMNSLSKVWAPEEHGICINTRPSYTVTALSRS